MLTKKEYFEMSREEREKFVSKLVETNETARGNLKDKIARVLEMYEGRDKIVTELLGRASEKWKLDIYLERLENIYPETLKSLHPDFRDIALPGVIRFNETVGEYFRELK